jgi:prephenate dehydrogenase
VDFPKVTIAGVGLLGGSLGLAIRQRGLAAKVDGLVRRSASIRECERLGVVDHATRNPVKAAQDADLIVLATRWAACETCS